MSITYGIISQLDPSIRNRAVDAILAANLTHGKWRTVACSKICPWAAMLLGIGALDLDTFMAMDNDTLIQASSLAMRVAPDQVTRSIAEWDKSDDAGRSTILVELRSLQVQIANGAKAVATSRKVAAFAGMVALLVLF